MNDRKDSDSPMMWVGLGAGCFVILGALVWLVASHSIVYYLTPVMNALAFPWRLLPTSLTGSTVPDLDFNYVLFRRHAAHVSLGDWLSYVSVAVKPWSVLFAFVAAGLFVRQTKKIKNSRINARLTPNELARNMMNTFTDIAPVVEIQEKLVANKLPRWARQVFPEEFIRAAKYQGQPVLVPDRESDALVIDKDRMTGFLRQTTKYKHGNKVLLRSPFLGRQIVDVRGDGAESKPVVFVDRLSDAGKAIYAILAPYAFNNKQGKAQSKAVSDALNMSAYGSPQGMANLSIPEVAESFEKWRDHPLARKLAKIHHWEYTFLYALLEHAQRSGKIGTWSCIWLKPTDRIMFYTLNTVGRKTPHSESGLAFSQVQYERKVVRKGRIPIQPDGQPVIFTERLIDALCREWTEWLNGDDDSEEWWKDEKLGDWEQNSALMSALSDLNAAKPVPANIE
ncbi:Uncharacterised protein [Achromobacter sp. 2789STDY5608633]|uniref:secretion/conjugation apparatus DotM-related subunit n=1 Tax=Achromobacter sp. 2789STDY5608633 TaxID=1806501 RepID=UPI0006C305B5|nr:hypothetical protein [Achromobacter sp. 2789STDY5608633]CUJ51339.1 Uncharacterised protein [Achromobacter sp. 2789STDY5608633]